ncbi:MAG: RNA polymerase factor sigma-54 [Haliea sp.]|nr:RNA polymerase factor sigma-54 [Haliea sp.]MDP5063130.1 RNA polymerase factor sigma-54 [Haliea sp.]
MKQSLQLKLGQQLTMTPQLQQAIKLLQLSTLDLQQEIQQALDSNPLLELAEDEYESEAQKPDGLDQDLASGDGSMERLERGEREERDGSAAAEDWQSNTLPDELPVDTQWDDLLPSSSAPASQQGDDAFEGDFDTRNNARDSLQDQLLWQLNLTRLSDTDRVIAMAIIDATDANGRLQTSVDDLHDALAPELDIDLEEIVAVLHCLQQFEPAGVCTRDLQECLLVQLQQLPADTPCLEQARLMISRHMAQLGNGDYKQIMRRMRLSEVQLRAVLDLIRTLDPNPGQGFGEDTTEYVVPDVFVSKRNGRWLVELNPDIAPKLRINDSYASMIRRADSSADNTFLKDNLQEARWFLKSLHSRNETLMKVASKIVEHQRNFLELGEEAMKPLVLHDIAEAIDMHESTISRATTRKYMHTPRGIFELKYFFSSHVSTTEGGEASSTAIKALIRKLVSAENPRKPLSDSKVATLLEEQGLQVARRTVAKYREILMIPPSNERKRLV